LGLGLFLVVKLEECLGCFFYDSHQAAGVVLLLHCGYVSAPTDFGVSWQVLGGGFMAAVGQ